MKNDERHGATLSHGEIKISILHIELLKEFYVTESKDGQF